MSEARWLRNAGPIELGPRESTLLKAADSGEDVRSNTLSNDNYGLTEFSYSGMNQVDVEEDKAMNGLARF